MCIGCFWLTPAMLTQACVDSIYGCNQSSLHSLLGLLRHRATVNLKDFPSHNIVSETVGEIDSYVHPHNNVH